MCEFGVVLSNVELIWKLDPGLSVRVPNFKVAVTVDVDVMICVVIDE